MRVIQTTVVTDYVAAKTLLSTGTVAAQEYGAVQADSFSIPISEYAVLYSAALTSGHFCPTKYHTVAMLLEQKCDCLNGWIPLLSASFIAALNDPVLKILSLPPEHIALRLGLRRSFSGLGERDSALLAAGILTSCPSLVCTRTLTSAYVATARQLGLEVLELDHADCSPAVNGQAGPAPGR